jgi:hypothetical protein
MNDAHKDTDDTNTAGAKRDGAAAEIAKKPNAKRTSRAGPLATLNADQRCTVLHACGQTLAVHAADKIKGSMIYDHICSMPIGERASMITKLAADNHNEIVTILLQLPVPSDLWLCPVGTESLIFELMESRYSGVCIETLRHTVDLRVLNARSPVSGDTLLHRVVERLDVSLVRHMLLCGVDVLPNNHGYHALYAPLIEAVDDIDVEKMASIITEFHRARQTRPGLFDPNAVVGGETFLGLLCRLPYPQLLTPWLRSFDCDLQTAPGKVIDESRMPKWTTIEIYRKESTNFMSRLCSGQGSLTCSVKSGLQLRHQTELVFDAIYNGRIEIIREIIRQKGGFMFNTEYMAKAGKKPPLEYIGYCRRIRKGSRRNDLEIAALIVDQLTDFKEKSGRVALFHAVDAKYLDLIKLYVDRGAPLTSRGGSHDLLWKAIQAWATDADDEIIRFLVRHGVRLAWDYKEPELVVAARHTGIGPLRVLLEGDNPPNVLTDALEVAAASAKTDFIQLLLAHNAQPSTKVLRAAAKSGNREVVGLLIPHMLAAGWPLVEEIIDLVAGGSG